jgi:alkylhydroperoxidase/carboxymuconolactone decarboxylase family protein YurZ
MTTPAERVKFEAFARNGLDPKPRLQRAVDHYKEILRKLALNDEGYVQSALGMGRDTVEESGLDQKTHAMVRFGALLAIDAAPSSYQANAAAALAAGATIDEIVGTLIAVAPAIGLTRVVSAAPELALALGYDVDAAFEDPEADPP